MRTLGLLISLAVFALGFVAAACSPASTPTPTPSLTIADPSVQSRPSPTIEVPPPID